jgi:hypothetical protein
MRFFVSGSERNCLQNHALHAPDGAMQNSRGLLSLSMADRSFAFLIGGKSVGDLETNGVVFVEDDTLVFPLVLLLNLAHAGHAPHVPLLLQKFDVMLSCDESERNSQSIFATKCVALNERFPSSPTRT